MSVSINDDQYSAFVLGVTGALPVAPARLLWLGYGAAYADHGGVIEAAVRGTPVRFSFKFSENLSPRCRINLRPYSEKLGGDGYDCKERFEAWIKSQYGKAVELKSRNNAFYFKPFGHAPGSAGNTRANTIDTFFDLGDEISLARVAEVKSCPEFPALGRDVVVKLTLIEAVSRILQRLR